MTAIYLAVGKGKKPICGAVCSQPWQHCWSPDGHGHFHMEGNTEILITNQLASQLDRTMSSMSIASQLYFLNVEENFINYIICHYQFPEDTIFQFLIRLLGAVCDKKGREVSFKKTPVLIFQALISQDQQKAGV